jgi:hypothetical protein
MKGKKPLRYYVGLFEDLMQYTKFVSTDQITQSNLQDFFDQVDDHSESKGRPRNFRTFDEFKNRMKQAFRQITKTGISLTTAIEQKLFPSRRASSFRQAQQNDLIITTYFTATVGKRKQKSLIKRGEKVPLKRVERNIYVDGKGRSRDSKGRFAPSVYFDHYRIKTERG